MNTGTVQVVQVQTSVKVVQAFYLINFIMMVVQLDQLELEIFLILVENQQIIDESNRNLSLETNFILIYW